MATKYNGVQVPEGADAADGPKAFRDAVDAGNFVPLFNTTADRDAWTAPDGALASTLTPAPGALWRRESGAWVEVDPNRDATYVNVAGDTMTGALIIGDTTAPTQTHLKGPATGANDLAIGRNDLADGVVQPRILLYTGNATLSALIRASDVNGGVAQQGVLDLYSRTTGGLRHIDSAKSNRVTDLVAGSTRRYATTAAMVADQANCGTGQVAVTTDTNTTWTRTAAGWELAYAYYATTAERDLATSSPADGALAFCADTGLLYMGSTATPRWRPVLYQGDSGAIPQTGLRSPNNEEATFVARSGTGGGGRPALLLYCGPTFGTRHGGADLYLQCGMGSSGVPGWESYDFASFRKRIHLAAESVGAKNFPWERAMVIRSTTTGEKPGIGFHASGNSNGGSLIYEAPSTRFAFVKDDGTTYANVRAAAFQTTGTEAHEKVAIAKVSPDAYAEATAEDPECLDLARLTIDLAGVVAGLMARIDALTARLVSLGVTP